MLFRLFVRLLALLTNFFFFRVYFFRFVETSFRFHVHVQSSLEFRSAISERIKLMPRRDGEGNILTASGDKYTLGNSGVFANLETAFLENFDIFNLTLLICLYIFPRT